MAYNSTHTGAEIDAAVEMLDQIQSARDSTRDDRDEVKRLSSQTTDNASQVARQVTTVNAKADQVQTNTVAVEKARSEVANAEVITKDARDTTLVAANSAKNSQASANASEQAAAQSQLAAGLSEQVSAENADVTTKNLGQVQSMVNALQVDVEAVGVSAEKAKRSADNAAAVVTGGTATFTPEPGKIPLSDGDGTLDSDWLRKDIARTREVETVAATVAALDVKDDPAQGAAGIAWDGQQISQQLDLSKKLHDYAELRAYFGSATRVEITKAGIAGPFELDLLDKVSADDSGTVIVGAGGRRWKRQFVGLVNVAWYEGATSTNATAALQGAIDESQAKGLTTIEVNTELDCPDMLAGRSRVMLRGEGKLKGAGAYRKQVFSWNAQSGRQFFNDLDPVRHLQRFSSAKNPTVVLVGSSTGAWSPNSVDTASTVARLLSDRIARYNPDRQVKFHNRCIGAQSYDQLDGVPTLFPAWYADHAKPWLDYIKDLAPDVVFIIMGSGDSGAMSFARIKSVTDKIKAFAKVPDIVYFTQPSVNPDPHPNYSAFGTKPALEGRDYAAGLIRSFAQFYKYGMIDANRVGGIVLDGRDLLDTISERVVGARSLANGEYTSPYPAHDFSFRAEFAGDAAAIDKAFLNAANPVFFRVGAGVSDARGGDIVFVRKNAAGKFRFELFAKGAGNYNSIDTDVAFPAGPFSLDVFKSGNTVGVSVANAEDSTFMMFPVIAHGGEFPAQFGYRNGGGPFSMLAYQNIGTPKQYLPALTSQQAWGERSADATTQLPYGGNGVNHFSSLGTTFIYGPLLNREVLTAARQADGTYTPLVGEGTNVAGMPTPSVAMWSRVGDSVTVSGAINITPAAAGTTQVDLTLPIPTTLEIPADLAGVCGVGGALGMMGSVWGNNAVHRARIQITTQVTTAQNVRYSYTYRLK